MADGFEPMVKRCVICGREFTVTNARSKDREYCDRNGPCRWRRNEMAKAAQQRRGWRAFDGSGGDGRPVGARAGRDHPLA